MRTTPKVLLVVPAVAGAALVAGCGGSSKASAPPTTPLPSSVATVTDTISPPTTTATTSTTVVAGPQPCATAVLTISLGDAGAAAGSAYYPLHFVNKGSAPCTITGFPGVSFVAPGNGAQVGAAAVRTGSAGSVVTLAAGAEATSLLQVADYANFTQSVCKPTAVSGFRVYVPGSTAASYVPLQAATQACSGDLSSTGSNQLSVQSVRAGTSGQ